MILNKFYLSIKLFKVLNKLCSIYMGFCYLLIEREFIRLKDKVLKLGRTDRTIEQRLTGYSKDTKVLKCIFVKDSKYVEKKLIEIFDKLFYNRRDIGREYYEGDMELMISEFIHICKLYSDIEEYITTTKPKNKTNGVKKYKNDNEKIIAENKIIVKKENRKTFYKCELCKYATHCTKDYIKHTETKSHKILLNESSDNESSDNETSDNESSDNESSDNETSDNEIDEIYELQKSLKKISKRISFLLQQKNIKK